MSTRNSSVEQQARSPKPWFFMRWCIYIRALVSSIITRAYQFALAYSAVVSGVLYRLCLKPDKSLFIWPLIIVGEVTHLVGFSQLVLTFLVLFINRGFSNATRFTKALLLANIVTAILQFSLTKQAFKSYDVYKQALKTHGISSSPFKTQKRSGAFVAMLMALLPRFNSKNQGPLRLLEYDVAPNHFSNKDVSSDSIDDKSDDEVVQDEMKNLQRFSYADMSEVDPKLMLNLEHTPNIVEKISTALGRGRRDAWLDLDIIRSDSILRKLKRSRKKERDGSNSNKNKLSSYPVVLYIHGGGWASGSKELGLHGLSESLTEQFDVVLVKANYRLSPEVLFPEMFYDVQRAINFVKKHISKFGGDPSRICLMGESAGGHLVSLAAATNGRLDIFKPSEFTGDEDVSVDLVVDIYGVHDFLKGDTLYTEQSPIGHWAEKYVLGKKRAHGLEPFIEASPTHQLKARLEEANHGNEEVVVPPMLMLHGDKDALTSIEDTIEFFSLLKSLRKCPGQGKVTDFAGVEKEVKDVFVELPGAHHGFGYATSPRAVTTAMAIVSFMEHYFGPIARPVGSRL